MLITHKTLWPISTLKLAYLGGSRYVVFGEGGNSQTYTILPADIVGTVYEIKPDGSLEPCNHPIYSNETIEAMEEIHQMILKARADGTIDELMEKLRAYRTKPDAPSPIAKTLQQLWDETSEAIKDPVYQVFCNHLENKTAHTVKEMAKEIPGLWDMTCAAAQIAVTQWVKKREQLDPNWLAEYKAELRKRL